MLVYICKLQVDVTMTTGMRWTSPQVATYLNDPEMLFILLHAGADVHAPGWLGKTVVHVAAYNGSNR